MARSASITATISGPLAQKLSEARSRTPIAVRNCLSGFEDELRKYMQANHPWKNRTGNAERGLGADLVSRNDRVDITLYHSVYYGVYLEYSMEQRFAILGPTLDAKGREITERLRGKVGEFFR